MTGTASTHPFSYFVAAGASLWALVITVFIVALCAIAQLAALVCECLLLPITRRWECANLLRDIGAPRIVALWEEVGGL